MVELGRGLEHDLSGGEGGGGTLRMLTGALVAGLSFGTERSFCGSAVT